MCRSNGRAFLKTLPWLDGMSFPGDLVRYLFPRSSSRGRRRPSSSSRLLPSTVLLSFSRTSSLHPSFPPSLIRPPPERWGKRVATRRNAVQIAGLVPGAISPRSRLLRMCAWRKIASREFLSAGKSRSRQIETEIDRNTGDDLRPFLLLSLVSEFDRRGKASRENFTSNTTTVVIEFFVPVKYYFAIRIKKKKKRREKVRTKR